MRSAPHHKVIRRILRPDVPWPTWRDLPPRRAGELAGLALTACSRPYQLSAAIKAFVGARRHRVHVDQLRRDAALGVRRGSVCCSFRIAPRRNTADRLGALARWLVGSE